MAKVIFTDEERAAAKAAGSMLFVYVVQPPENRADQGQTYRAGPIPAGQAEDLTEAVFGQLRKFKQVAT